MSSMQNPRIYEVAPQHTTTAPNSDLKEKVEPQPIQIPARIVFNEDRKLKAPSSSPIKGLENLALSFSNGEHYYHREGGVE